MKQLKQFAWAIPILLMTAAAVQASEADLAIPDLNVHGSFKIGTFTISAGNLLFYGSFVILGTLGISLYQLVQIHKQPAHKSMLDVAAIIFETCKTYLIQQGKFLLMLFAFIATAMAIYFWLERDPTEEISHTARTVGLALLFSIVGMPGSY